MGVHPALPLVYLSGKCEWDRSVTEVERGGAEDEQAGVCHADGEQRAAEHRPRLFGAAELLATCLAQL